MDNDLFEVGDTVIYKRGALTGKSKVVKTITASLCGIDLKTYYVLDYHPNGEIFKEEELKKVE